MSLLCNKLIFFTTHLKFYSFNYNQTNSYNIDFVGFNS